jgi:23S rRNA (guanine2445-N2)-methyltransferase / 23S rRNA (guanine2069-N7)-methyltransferase
MEHDFDVQRDHAALIRSCMRLLSDGGQLLFSDHFRRFKLDPSALAEFSVENITKKTLPIDFQRDPRFHNSWRITKR